jgi:hypothetical protein
MLLASEASHKGNDAPDECKAKAIEIVLFTRLELS